MKTFLLTGAVLAAFTGSSIAADLNVQMYEATNEGQGQPVGMVAISVSDEGAVFNVALKGMQAGSEHGFHVHANPSCDPKMKDGVVVPALAAGGHWDPENTGRHEGASGAGHLGDLPRLQANEDGAVKLSVTALRIKDVDALKGHALMVHKHGDNYSDVPKKLGGGGPRLFCGVIN